MTVLTELSKYKLDLVGVQEVRWEGSGTEPAGEYIFFYGEGNENHELGTGFVVHKRIILPVKGDQFVSDRMLYIILRGRQCDISPNVVTPVEDRIDVKDTFYGELGHVFDKEEWHLLGYYTMWLL
jgi:hypothetical protein